jgi:multiple sugar transport system substrate-binding protein
MSVLRGITWDHPRGTGGLDATARAFTESHDGALLSWERRSLQSLREQGLKELAGSYDLLIVDHPSIGSAAKTGCLHPLDSLIPREFLELQHEQSVGPSHRSYEYAGRQWALAVDASAQVSVHRPDLLGTAPVDWDSVTEIALRNGSRVALPLGPHEAFSSFLTLCANGGEPPFLHDGAIVSRDAGLHALAFLQRMAGLVNSVSFTTDTLGILEIMSATDEVSYAPLLFGYSNYSRPGFREHPLRFSDIPSAGYGPTGSLLGGAGIAISSTCSDLKAAAEYVMWVCQPEVQRGLYFESGGQPGNRVAWLDDGANVGSDGFFRRTLATLTGAYLRPRHEGYVSLHSNCGKIIHEGLLAGRDPEKVYSELNEVYAGTKAPVA